MTLVVFEHIKYQYKYVLTPATRCFSVTSKPRKNFNYGISVHLILQKQMFFYCFQNAYKHQLGGVTVPQWRDEV